MSDQPAREIRIRDRWILVGATFAVAGFLAQFVYSFIGDSWLEVLTWISIAAMFLSVGIAVRWNRRTNP